MPLIRYRPAAPLSHYVECLWWSRRDAAQDYWEHMLPSGQVQLVFALHQQPLLCLQTSWATPICWSGSLVHGPQSGYYLAGPKPAGAVAGVSFRPGAAGAVLGVAAAELADRHLGLEELWGARAGELREQFLAAADPAAIFQLLEQNLSRRIQRPLLMHRAVAQALLHEAPWAPGWTAKVRQASGYSPRHFIALFRGAVGLPPKQYQRIQRFNQVLRQLAGAAASGLADAAASGGYADQAHFSREFRALAGVSPTQYRPRPGSPLHHAAAAVPETQVKNLQDRGRA